MDGKRHDLARRPYRMRVDPNVAVPRCCCIRVDGSLAHLDIDQPPEKGGAGRKELLKHDVDDLAVEVHCPRCSEVGHARALQPLSSKRRRIETDTAGFACGRGYRSC